MRRWLSTRLDELGLSDLVESKTTEKYRSLLAAAPRSTQAKVRAAYRLWSTDPHHPSLRFKKVHSVRPIYSVRIDLDWRALGLLQEGTMVWFWVGPHSEYEKVLSRF